MTGPNPAASTQPALVFLLDVDNTLLDNDRVKDDLARHVEQIAGPERAARFWDLYEKVRAEKDFVDYPTTVDRWTELYQDEQLAGQVRSLLEGFPFSNYLYPHVLETLEYLWTLGTPVILSDGDPVFQPHKIQSSGLAAAVRGNVLVYVHKEANLPAVFERYPAGHYVSVDDKPRILAALESCCPTTFTTILVLQGKYASDDSFEAKPDWVLTGFEALRRLKKDDFLHPERNPNLLARRWAAMTQVGENVRSRS